MGSRTHRTTTERDDKPEDAHRGFVAPAPGTVEEAVADRAMAEAERLVAAHAGSEDQQRRVSRMGEARTHEDRRTIWIDRPR